MRSTGPVVRRARQSPFGPILDANGSRTGLIAMPAKTEKTSPKPKPTTKEPIAAARIEPPRSTEPSPPSVVKTEPPLPDDPLDLENAPMPRKTDPNLNVPEPAANDDEKLMTDPTVEVNSTLTRKPNEAAVGADPAANANPSTTAAGTSKTTKPEPNGKIAEPAAPVSLIRTERQFRDAIRRLGPRGGTMRLAADADLIVTTVDLRGPGAGRSKPRRIGSDALGCDSSPTGASNSAFGAPCSNFAPARFACEGWTSNWPE